jgi:hypothetical protein
MEMGQESVQERDATLAQEYAQRVRAFQEKARAAK